MYRLRYSLSEPAEVKCMDVRVGSAPVRGRVRAPPSKSYSHRAILLAGMANGSISIAEPLRSADTKASERVATAFGATVQSPTDRTIEIEGCRGTPEIPDDVINCANSGTTMRLAIGLSSLVDGMTVLTGDQSLRSRPQGPLLRALSELGAETWSTRGTGEAPVVIKGPIKGGPVSIPGDVSSQYISSLLMAGALTANGIQIDLETSLKSAPYVDITREVMREFGADSQASDDHYSVSGGQSYSRDRSYAVPGDFSSISYLASAGAIAGDPTVTIEGAAPGAQGDSAIVDILDRMGADVDWNKDDELLTVGPGSLTGVEVDVGDTPDLLPTIAAIGAVAGGVTRIVNCEHVRYKETDRVSAMAHELDRLGAVVEESHEELIVRGGESDLTGAEVDGHRDHRIIMALTIAALGASGQTTITGASHVDVSFPDFFDVMADLGMDIRRTD